MNIDEILECIIGVVEDRLDTNVDISEHNENGITVDVETEISEEDRKEIATTIHSELEGNAEVSYFSSSEKCTGITIKGFTVDDEDSEDDEDFEDEE